MKRAFTFLIVVGLLGPPLSGCPNPETGKIDPYLTAKTIINQAQTALSLADGIFNQWLISTKKEDADKQKIQATYHKTKTGVANGLQLALNGVSIAEQAKEDPDVTKLMLQANNAWASLRKFMVDLLNKDPAGVSPMSNEVPPIKTSGGISSRASALTVKNPAEMLPRKLE